MKIVIIKATVLNLLIISSLQGGDFKPNKPSNRAWSLFSSASSKGDGFTSASSFVFDPPASVSFESKTERLKKQAPQIGAGCAAATCGFGSILGYVGTIVGFGVATSCAAEVGAVGVCLICGGVGTIGLACACGGCVKALENSN